jgi:ABC-type Fe3+/spermidine/putrescine transport system ATPase subunit
VVLDRVSRRFGGVAAVHQVSLHIARGEFFSLLGPSGCGKTTTLRLIAGFDAPEPDGGTIALLGEVVNHRRPYQRPIGMVFQSYALFPHLDVARNVAFGLEERRTPSAAIPGMVDRALELVRLDPGVFRRRRPAELSGGQRQRVALARALVLQPPVLLLDEPLGALDLQLRKEMQLELRQLNRQLGITFILVTHDQEEALVMSDRIAVMSNGRVEQVGTPAEIYQSPGTEFVARFIGDANFFDGVVSHIAGDLAQVRSPDGAWHVPAGGRSPGDPLRIAVRPEWHDLIAPGHGQPLNHVAGTIGEIVFMGESRQVIVRTGRGVDMRVTAPALRRGENVSWRLGDPVLVSWRSEDAIVLE